MVAHQRVPRRAPRSLILLEPPGSPDPDDILETLLSWVGDNDLTLYPAQEEAVLELLADRNVILTTPTGSGKSLVAVAQHLGALARGERSFYTAPIKALVSEKFFELRRLFGQDRVGMITGDASINPDAPVICCTAEILANLALRSGSSAAVDRVAIDEFHFYADRDRGWAWQVPILELPQCSFLLMSATLGPPDVFERALTELTGRPTSVVSERERPVPLEFEYRETPLHETVSDLLAADRAPVYVVHFTQRSATEQAQNFMSLDVLTKSEKARVRSLVEGFRFDTPFGKDLRRYVTNGIGIHHAGLLPKYRLLVERLAQEGLLKLISGTDTLGVGVNVPIRTVLFTQLCKFDGSRTRVLSVRDFQQIAGRAGRKGYDDHGYVWAQAPDHVVENKRAVERAAASQKRKKVVKKKQPDRGYAHWDEARFDKLAGGEPEALRSSFSVSHSMLLSVLDRPGDGCAAMRTLLVANHDRRRDQRQHIRRAIAIYRSLLSSGVIEELSEADDLDRRVRITVDLQGDFALNQPLSPFVLDVVAELDEASADYGLDVLTVVESVLEDPVVVLRAQLDRVRDELIAELKADGVEYDERMARLDETTWPQPDAEQLRGRLVAFATHHPWVGAESLHPKSVARDMYERAMTFRDYVVAFGLKRSEGVLLRYLSDVYKTLLQTVPDPAKTDEVWDIIDWLGAVVRQVDSSLIDEWEQLVAGETAPERPVPETVDDVTTDERAFRALVRTELFAWVQLLARQAHPELAERVAVSSEELDAATEPYWAEHEWIGIDGEARAADHFELERGADAESWSVTQWLVDPAGTAEWRVEAHVDVPASREEGRAVVVLDQVRRR